MFRDNFEADGKTKVAIYTRVSTQEQEVDGYGLDAQNSKLRGHVANNPGLNLETREEWIFSDTDTGSILERENLTKLRALVKEKKVQAVLVWKIDRLSRNLQHLLILFDEFEKAGVSLISLQENINFAGPIGKLVFQMFGAIAQFERELIKDRTKVGRIASAEAGNFTGASIPYGYKAVFNPNGKGKKIDIIPEEKTRVKKIFDWYIYDKLGFGEIADKLNNLRVPLGQGSTRKRKDSKWTIRMVGSLIENRVYTGAYIANKTRHDGSELPTNQWTIVNVPACIDNLTYTLAANIREGKAFGNNKKYLLSGKLRDISVTPARGMSGVKRSKGGYSYRRKPFTENNVKHSVYEVPMKPLDDYVWSKIVYAFQNPKQFVNNYLIKVQGGTDSTHALETEITRLKSELAKTQLTIDRLMADYYDEGKMSEDRFLKMLKEREARSQQLNKALEETESMLYINESAQVEVNTLKEIAAGVRDDLSTISTEQKKILVDLFVDRIDLLQETDNEGNKKRTAHIYYRFNPKKWLEWRPMGCTEESLSDNKKRPTDSQKDENGATCRT